MQRSDVWAVLGLAAAAGLLGGLMAGALTSTTPVLAEKTPAAQPVPQKVMSAESFFVVDQQGQVHGALSLSPDNGQPTLVLLDKQGKARLRVGLLADGRPAVYVDGKDGEPFWYEP